jgi:hypothetical protein
MTVGVPQTNGTPTVMEGISYFKFLSKKSSMLAFI